MAKPKNPVLARQETARQQAMHIAKVWAYQTAYDAVTLVLGDPAIMGHNTIGEKRLGAIYEALQEKIDSIERGLMKTPEASYVRAQTDRELKKRQKSLHKPWEERYFNWDDSGI